LNGQIESRESFNKFLSSLTFEHFIGKDIIYFHSFLWINLIKFISPGLKIKQLNCHGWLTINQTKFSKSKGHQLNLNSLSSSQIDSLRFYFFTKHDGSIQDTEFFENEVFELYNQTIVNNLANFYARNIKIANKYNIKIQFNSTIPNKYHLLLENSNFKKLYELVNIDLANLNSEFQIPKLWNENNIIIIENHIQILLNKWFQIYLVLSLVCPDIKSHHEQILNSEFIHIAERLTPFFIF
jgi:methionyl-tRNA synthetase